MNNTIKNRTVGTVVEYGRITIETSKGDMEFSYQTGEFADYQI